MLIKTAYVGHLIYVMDVLINATIYTSLIYESCLSLNILRYFILITPSLRHSVAIDERISHVLLRHYRVLY